MMKPPLQKGTIMTKKTKSPWKMLADCVGTAIVAIALVPALIVDAVISSN